MASILLAAAGASIGAGFGGTILGLSGAVIGQAAGSILGTIIDSRIVASFAPDQISEGARLESLRVTSSTEGAVIPNVYGRMKIGGNIFWATDFLEKSTTNTQGGSGKGGGGGEVKTTTYAYSCSFAVGLCEGPISGIGRIWADGKPFDLPGAVWRVYTGTETQLSSFAAGVYLLFMVVVLGDLVSQIPMAALVAIMIMVSIGTFSWSSLKNLRLHPRSSSIVMIATVVTVVYTHNLAIGVLVGVLLSGIFFAGKIAQLFNVTTSISKDGRVRTYIVEGQLFYGSVEDFMNAFDFKEALDKVVIDVSLAHIWDISSVQALDMAVLKFRRDGAEVEIVGMNAATETIVDKLAIHDKPGAMDQLMSH